MKIKGVHMKAVFITLAALVGIGSPIVSQENKEQKISQVKQENQYQLGSQAIEQIRSNYKEGKYKDFLSEMDASYQKAKKNNELEGLIEIRKESANFSFPQEKLANGFEAIQKEKNKNLLEAASAAKDSVFVEKIRSAATPMSDATQKALTALAPYRTMAPGTGANSDENQLIEIDLESQYKAIHLDSLAAAGQQIPDRKEKHIALEMQRMDQMSEAAKSFQDSKLKSAVAVVASAQDEKLAKVYDMSDLNALAKGRVKPQNDLEEKVASIVANAQSQFSDLNRDLLNEAQANTAQK